MNSEDQWYHGKHEDGFAEAVKDALKHAEDDLRPPKGVRTEYDVRLGIAADGPLSEYKASIKPSH